MYEQELTRRLGKINVNRPSEQIHLQSYWCRIARTERMQWNPKEHSHSFWELHLCLQGTSRIRVGAEEHLMEPRTMLFFAPHRKHQILEESQDFVKFIWGVEFDEPAIARILLEVYENSGLLPVDDDILKALEETLVYSADDQFGAYDLLKQSLYRIFVLLVRRGQRQDNGIRRKETRKELELIFSYLRSNLDTSIDDVSFLFHISRSTVERLCRAEYQMTFHQLRQMLQAERIRELLEDTELSMDQIAAMTGFADRYSMGKFFKKHEGTPPGNYRKALNKG